MRMVYPVLFACTVAGCLGDSPAEKRLRITTDSDHPIQLLKAEPLAVRPTLLLAVGQENGPSAFAAIAGATVTASGEVLLNEGATCRLIRVGTDGALRLPGIGACGDGPGELRRVRSLAVSGDSVLVLLSDEPTYRTLLANGEEVGRGTTNDSLPLGVEIHAIARLAGSELAASLAIPPAVMRAQEGGMRSVGIIDLHTKGIRTLPLGVPSVSRQNVAPYLSGPSVCAFGPEGPLVVFNEWSPQLLVTDLRSGNVIAEVRVQGDYEPVALPSPMVGYRPRALASSVVCGKDRAVFWTREGEAVQGQTTISGGMIGIVDREGTVVGVGRYGPTDTLLFARPAGVSNGRLVSVSNSFTPFPQLLYLGLPWPLTGDSSSHGAGK
jgi:hypothetical protein